MPTALVAVFEWIGGALISGGAVNAGIYLIGAAGTWAAATVLVGTLALSQYQRRKAERAARAQYDASQVDRLVNLPATVAPRELVLGRVRKGGTVFFRGTTGYWFNSQFFMCISLAAHEIDAVEQIYFNDEPVTVNEEGFVTSAPYGRTLRETATMTPTAQVVVLPHTPLAQDKAAMSNGPTCIRLAGWKQVPPSPKVPTGQVWDSQAEIPVTVAGDTVTLESYDPSRQYRLTYEWNRQVGMAAVSIHLGGADQAADAGMKAAFPPGFWTDAHRARGVAYLVVQLQYDDNAFPSGLPNVTALVRGAKCYDPRTGVTAWTENPALHMLHVLTHPQFGKRTLASLSAGELARINAAANACDIATDYGAGSVARFRSGTVMPFGMAARDGLDDLSQAMAGMWAYAAGELYMRAGIWQAPVMHLTDDDLAVVQRSSDGSVSQTAMSIGVHKPRNEKINTVVARIWDEAANYVQTPLPPLRIEALVAADGAELSQEVNMPAVFHAGQAQHISGVMLRDGRDPLTAVLPFKLKAYPLEVFDSITLSLARYGWSAKEFLILGRTFTPEGLVVLTLKETSSAIYAVGAAVLPGGYADNTQLPRPWDILPPTITRIESGESALILQGDGTVVNGVRVQWAQITDPSILGGSGVVEVQFRPVTQEAWQSEVVPGSASSALLKGLADLEYIAIRARCRNSLATSAWGPVQYHRVIGKSEPPPDILNLSVSGSILSWLLPRKPPDLAGFVFRFHYGNSTDWNSAAPLHDGVLTESPYDLVTRPGGVVTIMGKAIDTSGHESDQAAVVVMNLGDPPIANVLEVWDFGALGWPAAAGEQSGWSLEGGLPSADALDSFYGTDDQSFYRGDFDSFYKDESYAEVVYVTEEVSVNSALAGSVMTLEATAQGIDLRIDYRSAGPGTFYAEDDQPFYGEDDQPFYGPPGAWLPWPGQIVAANDVYQFRVRLGAGASRGVLESLVMTIDAPDLEEEIADLAVNAAGTVVPYEKSFTAIKTVQATLQANGSGAVTAEIDKTVPLAPKVRAFNSAHVAVSGATVDITLKGY